MTRAETFVAMRAGAADWGIRETSVARVVSEEEWFGEAPIDLRAGAEIPADPGAGAPRVLLVRGAAGDFPVRAVGRLSIRSAEAADVLDLPSLVRCASGPIRVTAVVIADDRLPLLVLDPEALLGAHDARLGAPKNTP